MKIKIKKFIQIFIVIIILSIVLAIFIPTQSRSKYVLGYSKNMVIEIPKAICVDENNMYYFSIADAVESRSGETSTLTMLDNVEEDVTIKENDNVTLNLDSYIINGDVNIEKNGGLTLKNGTINGQEDKICIEVIGGTLNVEEVIINAKGKGGIALTTEKSANVELTSGEINGRICNMSNSELNIRKDMTVKYNTNSALITSYSTLKIYGATIIQEGTGDAVVISGGTARISRATVKGGGQHTIYNIANAVSTSIVRSYIENTDNNYALYNGAGTMTVDTRTTIIGQQKLEVN